MRFVATATFVLAVSAACTTPTAPPPIAPEEARVAAVPSPSETATATAGTEAPIATKPRAPAGAEGEAHDEPPPIGSPCTEADPRVQCGTAGRVAVVEQTIRMKRVPSPCVLTRISSAKSMDVVGACIDGDRVFVSKTCIPCRIPSEERVLGLVAQMTPAQLKAIQTRAGLPGEPLLTTTADWQSAIKTAAARSQTH